ncbi:MAG: triose-phosphate isomerase [Moraxellaceae bacterium]|nr:MAG: triose-phosphate isomerase [Moraxellaceae bacterium]
MRKQIAAANWKMNLSLHQAEELINAILKTDTTLADNRLAIFAVPFPYLVPIKQLLDGRQNVFIAAQNCSVNANGAYTGEVSAEMLQSIGVKYVILGHSERRQYNYESNRELAEKVNIALAHQVQPVFCCGEALSVREAGEQNEYVKTQLMESLFHLEPAQIKNFIIAYEPIWAIGTGKTASSGQAQEMHAHIRSVLAAKYGKEVADTVSILYGGSVKAANATEIFGQADVDGGLVGGASLVATEFAAIMQSLK